MSINWIAEQTKYNVAQWDTSMEKIYPEVKEWNKDPKKYYRRVCEECNFYDSVKLINWDNYLTENSQILDLGCGGGWLAAYLSKKISVGKIYAVDTSENYLYNIFPGIMEIMQGNSIKIIPIQGMFSPLLVENESLDMVVASAAIHHAENLEFLLKEIKTKLKKGGYLILLNETPSSSIRYLARLCLAFSKIFFKTLFQKYEVISPRISASGFEYDAHLGDKSYPLWYWEKALSNAGFEMIEYIETNLPTVKGTKQTTLNHMICKVI